MNEDAFKILRHTKERCPDCDSNGLTLIVREEEKDGITYSTKYLYCSVCEFEKEFKEKGKHIKFSEEDGEQDYDNNNTDYKRSTVKRNNYG